MKLSIDYREKTLLQRIPIEPSNLPLGDIVIEKDNKELIIIERKTVNDLVSSICDGRYKEQSFRLNESCVSNHNILYIIEGQLVDCTLTKKTLIASLISLWYHKGFTVYRTTDIDETAEFVQILFDKLQKDEDKPHVENDYTSTVKKQKRDKITPDNIDVIMLSQIPGISTTTASALMVEYKTVFQLEKKLRETPTCIDSFLCGKRKISKTCVENIKSYLHI